MGIFNFSNCIEKILLCMRKKGGMRVNDVEKQMNLPKEYVSCILDFLKYSMFIAFDEDKKCMKLSAYGNVLLDIS